MFYFVVHYLRWAARIPGAPHLFDALLVVSTALFRRSRLAAMEALENELLMVPGIRLKPHRYGGIEFLKDGESELGHLHGSGLLDVPVGREAATALIQAGRVRPHHVLPRSKWVSFQIESPADVGFALELLQLASVGSDRPRSVPT